MTRGYLNNNPLNIELSKGPRWIGEIRPSQDIRFAQFESMIHGYRAVFKLLYNYQKLHGCKVLADFINRWCPPTEKGNHTNVYIDVVAKRCGLTADSEINVNDEKMMCDIVAAMSFVENGIEPNLTDIRSAWGMHRNHL